MQVSNKFSLYSILTAYTLNSKLHFLRVALKSKKCFINGNASQLVEQQLIETKPFT